MKKLFAVCCALLVVGAAGCSEDNGKDSCNLTVNGCMTLGKYLNVEKCECADLSACTLSADTCTSLGRMFDIGTCTCIAKVNQCSLSHDICNAINKKFDSEKCECVAFDCDKSEIVCQAEGKRFDAVNCACIGGSGTCDKSEAICAADGGKTFDAVNCACIGGSGTCDKSEAICAADGGKRFDARTCSCVAPVCDKSAESCAADGGKRFDSQTCSCVAADCDKSAESCAADGGKRFDSQTCSCVAPVCDKSAESCAADGGKRFDSQTCSCVAADCEKNTESCMAEGKIFDAGNCECVACDKNAEICEANGGKAFDAANCACIDKTCDKSEEICAAEGKEFDATNCECIGKVCDKSEEICAAEGKSFDAQICECKCFWTAEMCDYIGREYDADACACKSCSKTTCENGNYLSRCLDNGAYQHIKCEYGCDSSTNDCKPNTAPTCTENACQGNTQLLCTNGKPVEVHCDYGCDSSTKSCKKKPDDVECTSDICKDSSTLKECVNGNYFEVACPLGCAQNACKTEGQVTGPVAGAACSESYEGGCSSDRTKRYYCGTDGKLVEKECNSNTVCVAYGNNTSYCIDESAANCSKDTYEPGCSTDLSVGTFCSSAGKVVTLDCKSLGKRCQNSSGYIQCQDIPKDCAPGITEYCNKTCKADGSEGYYYSKGMVHVVSCANHDCVIENGMVDCQSNLNQPVVPGEGDCDPATYEGGCSEDGKTRYYCNNSTHQYVSVACDAGKTCVVKGNNASRCESVMVSDCAPGGTEYCNKTCKADGSEGYYYSKGEVHVVSCVVNHDCIVMDGRVKCLFDSLQPTDEPVAGASCDSATYPGGCSTDKKTRFYCNDGQLVAKVCNNGQTCEVKGSNSSVCVGGSSTLPSDIPETCIHHLSPGLCSEYDGMPYVCGSTGEYYKKTCSKTCFECPDNYWVGCGDDMATVCEGHMGDW